MIQIFTPDLKLIKEWKNRIIDKNHNASEYNTMNIITIFQSSDLNVFLHGLFFTVYNYI